MADYYRKPATETPISIMVERLERREREIAERQQSLPSLVLSPISAHTLSHPPPKIDAGVSGFSPDYRNPFLTTVILASTPKPATTVSKGDRKPNQTVSVQDVLPGFSPAQQSLTHLEPTDGGMFGWLRKTVVKLLRKVAEKAKMFSHHNDKTQPVVTFGGLDKDEDAAEIFRSYEPLPDLSSLGIKARVVTINKRPPTESGQGLELLERGRDLREMLLPEDRVLGPEKISLRESVKKGDAETPDRTEETMPSEAGSSASSRRDGSESESGGLPWKFVLNHFKNQTYPLTQKTRSYHVVTGLTGPGSPTPTKNAGDGYCSYGRRDSLNSTKILLLSTSYANGKEAFKRITLPDGSNVDQLLSTVEKAMSNSGKCEAVLTLPDMILVEDDEQIRDFVDCQKIEAVFDEKTSSSPEETPSSPSISSSGQCGSLDQALRPLVTFVEQLEIRATAAEEQLHKLEICEENEKKLRNEVKILKQMLAKEEESTPSVLLEQKIWELKQVLLSMQEQRDRDSREMSSLSDTVDSYKLRMKQLCEVIKQQASQLQSLGLQCDDCCIAETTLAEISDEVQNGTLGRSNNRSVRDTSE